MLGVVISIISVVQSNPIGLGIMLYVIANAHVPKRRVQLKHRLFRPINFLKYCLGVVIVYYTVHNRDKKR